MEGGPSRLLTGPCRTQISPKRENKLGLRLNFLGPPILNSNSQVGNREKRRVWLLSWEKPEGVVRGYKYDTLPFR